ncbi:hypothetical protein JCM11641_004580 [Rhodosporidiobolus odoratus]
MSALQDTTTGPSHMQTGGGMKRARGASAMDFKSAATGVSAKAMRNELNAMIQKIDDPEYRKAFEAEMQSFFILFNRYLSERAKGQKIDWEKIEPPTKEQIVPYADLAKDADPALLDKLAVLKLNGGLGTTMGCVGPKSIIEVREGMTFLDLSVRQIEHLNSAHNVNVPFILMNSFNTDEDTARIIQKYANHRIELMTFNQSRYPRVNKETLLPVPKSALEDKAAWYPPGHGDLFDALMNSGLVDQLLSQGKEYLFVSNVDNLGAVVDLPILEHMHKTGAEYLLEVTDKTRADVKGGTLINYDGNFRLLEVAQVPSDRLEAFKSIRNFKIFNTNNAWIRLDAIKRIMENDGLQLDLIVNNKVAADGSSVIQLETALGAAIQHFHGAHAVNVPRTRFLPVKSCSDLLLLMSDAYYVEHGCLKTNPDRLFDSVPVIKLGNKFQKVHDFQKRFMTVPSLLELDHLTVEGDVYFGRDVKLAGTVIVVAADNGTIVLPDGSTLENKLVSGWAARSRVAAFCTSPTARDPIKYSLSHSNAVGFESSRTVRSCLVGAYGADPFIDPLSLPLPPTSRVKPSSLSLRPTLCIRIRQVVGNHQYRSTPGSRSTKSTSSRKGRWKPFVCSVGTAADFLRLLLTITAAASPAKTPPQDKAKKQKVSQIRQKTAAKKAGKSAPKVAHVYLDVQGRADLEALTTRRFYAFANPGFLRPNLNPPTPGGPSRTTKNPHLRQLLSDWAMPSSVTSHDQLGPEVRPVLGRLLDKGHNLNTLRNEMSLIMEPLKKEYALARQKVQSDDDSDNERPPVPADKLPNKNKNKTGLITLPRGRFSDEDEKRLEALIKRKYAEYSAAGLINPDGTLPSPRRARQSPAQRDLQARWRTQDARTFSSIEHVGTELRPAFASFMVENILYTNILARITAHAKQAVLPDIAADSDNEADIAAESSDESDESNESGGDDSDE